MDTIMVHGIMLFRLFEALSLDFVTDATLARKEIAVHNMSDTKLDQFMLDYDRDVDLLVENMSAAFGHPEEIENMFNNCIIELQLSLLMRYEFISYELKHVYPYKTFVVPRQIDELFKMLYIDGYRSVKALLKG